MSARGSRPLALVAAAPAVARAARRAPRRGLQGPARDHIKAAPPPRRGPGRMEGCRWAVRGCRNGRPYGRLGGAFAAIRRPQTPPSPRGLAAWRQSASSTTRRRGSAATPESASKRRSGTARSGCAAERWEEEGVRRLPPHGQGQGGQRVLPVRVPGIGGRGRRGASARRERDGRTDGRTPGPPFRSGPRRRRRQDPGDNSSAWSFYKVKLWFPRGEESKIATRARQNRRRPTRIAQLQRRGRPDCRPQKRRPPARFPPCGNGDWKTAASMNFRQDRRAPATDRASRAPSGTPFQ